MKGGIPALALLAASVSLAGCFGPKELPDWAMTHRSETAYTPRKNTMRTETARRSSERHERRTPGGPVSARSDDVLPYSPEWQARESALDDRLRRTMNFCRGC